MKTLKKSMERIFNNSKSKGYCVLFPPTNADLLVDSWDLLKVKCVSNETTTCGKSAANFSALILTITVNSHLAVKLPLDI